jgi:hypothetical protein
MRLWNFDYLPSRIPTWKILNKLGKIYRNLKKFFQTRFYKFLGFYINFSKYSEFFRVVPNYIIYNICTTVYIVNIIYNILELPWPCHGQSWIFLCILKIPFHWVAGSEHAILVLRSFHPYLIQYPNYKFYPGHSGYGTHTWSITLFLILLAS